LSQTTSTSSNSRPLLLRRDLTSRVSCGVQAGGSIHKPTASNPPLAAALMVSRGPNSGTTPEASEILFAAMGAFDR